MKTAHRAVSRNIHSTAIVAPHTLGEVGTEGSIALGISGDFAMTLQNLCKASSGARPVRLPACPQCGDMLLAPLLAEHVTAGLVHNHWVCESCGHTFRKSHEFEAEAL
jgi:ribosomal protein S27AE